MDLKKCNRCKILKPLEQFYKNKDYKDGRKAICKSCEIKYSKEYYIKNEDKVCKYNKIYWRKNKEERLEYQKKWKSEHKKELKEYKKKYREENRIEILNYCREYRERNRKKINEWYKNERKTNLKFRLNSYLGNNIRNSLKGNKKGRHWEDIVGYTLSDLVKRLGKTMPKDYTWQDYLEGRLHIDHKTPINAFNFSKPEHIDFKRCWALNNLRLLPAKENRVKYNKLLKPFQPSLAL